MKHKEAIVIAHYILCGGSYRIHNFVVKVVNGQLASLWQISKLCICKTLMISGMMVCYLTGRSGVKLLHDSQFVLGHAEGVLCTLWRLICPGDGRPHPYLQRLRRGLHPVCQVCQHLGVGLCLGHLVYHCLVRRPLRLHLWDTSCYGDDEKQDLLTKYSAC